MEGGWISARCPFVRPRRPSSPPHKTHDVPLRHQIRDGIPFSFSFVFTIQPDFSISVASCIFSFSYLSINCGLFFALFSSWDTAGCDQISISEERALYFTNGFTITQHFLCKKKMASRVGGTSGSRNFQITYCSLNEEVHIDSSSLSVFLIQTGSLSSKFLESRS